MSIYIVLKRNWDINTIMLQKYEELDFSILYSLPAHWDLETCRMPFAGYQVDEGPLGAWDVDVDCVLLAWNRASGRMEQKRR